MKLSTRIFSLKGRWYQGDEIDAIAAEVAKIEPQKEFIIDARMDKTLTELQGKLKLRTQAETVKHAVALMHAAAKHMKEDGTIVLRKHKKDFPIQLRRK